MSNPTNLSLCEVRDALRCGKLSSTALTEAYLESIAKQTELGAFITVTADKALKMANESDSALATQSGGALEGIPLGVKDMFCTQGVETTAASNILKGFVPDYESTVTRKLWDAGGVLLGKTNQDEFAMGSANSHSAFGPAYNPCKGTDGALRVPGGSSGGSAAAVAARLCAGALGTDTGGSIRQPAGFCGVAGIKPTYGRCSRWGVIAYGSSLDQAGPIARTVRDAAILLEVISGFDSGDSTSIDMPPPQLEAACEAAHLEGVRGLRVGIPKDYRIDGLASEMSDAWDDAAKSLVDSGAEIKEISLPHTQYALPAYYIIATAEASSNLARYDGVRYGQRKPADGLTEMYHRTRSAGFGDEVKKRIMLGGYVLSAGYYDAYYVKALKVRRLVATDFFNAFTDVDAILCPISPRPAFRIDESQDDPLQEYLQDVFSVTANLAGLPGLSVPVGQSREGLPIGMQLLGKPFDEETLFRLGTALEVRTI